MQLSLPLDASATEGAGAAEAAYLPLPAYDRLDVGVNMPLTDGEVAALLHHGYRIGPGPERGVYVVVGQIDGRDGEMDADDLRCDLDLFYLAAKAAQPARHPLDGIV